jgi:type IV secretion system protein TrbL
MAAPGASILPPSYFDGLSELWGACAYVGGAIVAAGLVLHAARARPEPTSYLWLFAKVFLIGIATLFLREWLMRLNDVVLSLGSYLGIDPRTVDNKFVAFISGKTPAQPEASVWDVIWNTGSVGTAVAYALLWMFGWLSWSVQYVVKLIGGILLTTGWALSPLFLSFFILPPMAGVARKYIIGLAALVFWPFGWTIAAVVTNAMIDTAATASLIPVVVGGGSMVAPALTVLLVGAWMLLSSILAPYVTTRVLLMGANPAAAFAQSVGGVAQAALAGGVGAATAAVTGGVAAAGVAGAAAVGAMAAGAESAARGGGSPRTTATAVGGLAGFYGGRLVQQQATAMKEMASAQSRHATAAEAFSEEFTEHSRQRRRRTNQTSEQPHHPDPNQAAIEIEAREQS